MESPPFNIYTHIVYIGDRSETISMKIVEVLYSPHGGGGYILVAAAATVTLCGWKGSKVNIAGPW